MLSRTTRSSSPIARVLACAIGWLINRSMSVDLSREKDPEILEQTNALNPTKSLKQHLVILLTTC